MISNVVFFALAVLTIGFAVVVVTSRSVFHGAIALTAALSMIAGLFALLGADFLAASQVLVYVGGIMIIMLFVVMLSQQPADALRSQRNEQWFWALLFAIAIGAHLVQTFQKFFGTVSGNAGMVPTSAAIGRLLLGDMIVPFEAVSLVLLAALVGAVVFGQDRHKGPVS
jgi:NADH:ubiquinone oxidoreductase subunit 6 (subunit J)